MHLFYQCTRFAGFLLYLCFSVVLFSSQKSASANVIAPLRTKKAMVVSAHPLASEAGVAMLRKGENAVDAAVATTFAISVVEPFSAGIGGGGFLLLHQPKTGEMKALDFRERAPLKATKNMYLDAQGKVPPNLSVNGYLAVHLLQILNIIGDTDLKSLGWHHPDALHLMVEAMKIAYADRSQLLGDPDFVKVPVAQLISLAYAKKRRQQINMERATPSSEVKPADKATLQQLSQPNEGETRGGGDGGTRGKMFFASARPRVSASFCLLVCLSVCPKYESPETSHLTVVDEQRNAVSLTFTVNYGFGSGVVVPGTGILMNDEMDDFAAAPGVPNTFGLVGAQANAIRRRRLRFAQSHRVKHLYLA